MATGKLTQTVYNEPYGKDVTDHRSYLHGTMTFGAGNYVTGGLLPNWTPTTGILGPLQDQSGQNVLLSTYTQPAIANITAVTVSGTTCTFNTKTPPTVGQYVTLGGFTVAALLPFNGITAQVTTSTAGTSFVCTITTTATTSANSGQAVTVIGPDTLWMQTINGSGFSYSYNKTNGLVQIFTGSAAQSPSAELAAGALPAGVTGDTVEFEAEYVTQ
jgi:hypothetical protein